MKRYAILLTACAMAMTMTAQQVTKAPLEDVNKVRDLTLDSLNKANTARPIPGSSRKGDNPVLFLVGNSTMRTGTLGNGNNGQWGWGYFAHQYFDKERITVENHALGGTSSRTFYNKLWPAVLEGVKPGDWVIIELGHNDNGPYDHGRARASIPGIGTDSMVVTIQETGVVETVYSYGEYMRRFIRDVREKGAHPVLCSLTPRNSWVGADGAPIATTEDLSSQRSLTITRKRETFTRWQQEIAHEMGVPWIDLEGTTARKFEVYGPWKVNYMFYLDKIHTSEWGARTNARSAAEAIEACEGLALKEYLLPLDLPKEKFVRVAGKPVVFFTGDSTVKNEDKDADSMWGWGSVAHTVFNTKKCTLVNAAMAGRSARTFLEEGRWDKVYNSIEPGDYVLIQFGHNDMGDIAGGKARADIRGVRDSSHVYQLEKDRTYKVVYSYGWYLRKFVGDVREKGGIPVIVSMTPRNEWPEGKMERRPGSCASWAKEVAEELEVAFVDMHNLTADYLDRKAGSKEKAEVYYKRDHTHTSLLGAELNAKMFRKGIKKTDCGLKKLMK